MKNFQIIYDENKKLDEIFDELYDSNKKEIIEKNILELLVELGELANETRCFKYWSNKKPSEKDVVLEEYADCLIMIFYFCNMVNLDLKDICDVVDEKNVIKQFIEIYSLASNLKYKLDDKIISKILVNVINLGYLLSFSESEIVEGCLKKIEKNKLRFETGF